ncbi:pyruvate carboxylase [Alkalibacter saccharofermentans]|uniref:Pyruvate carboxylase n=1 Tax=Alkalibacter saccharofermentans DSM 14828 TaxID=1120975 RepID=A0A1M4VTP7_9FIRM|nr:pyruvate carboxylase [Alkalibacter saccharofermentans]SHE72318.1 pyruvate carboxylase [Alkalibacter saccharofermentans DSM 14828]
MNKFKKVLIANRGEIAIRIIRACQELGISTVAIYAEEDKLSLFRRKADEAYLIEDHRGPVDAYLNMDKIINLAKKKNVDAIHPGYGFLSENPEFARKCESEGIVFIGPNHIMMKQLGDKIQSKIQANKVGVPTIPGVEKPIENDEEAVEFARIAGYPIMLKAAAGGGGRGMRIVKDEKNLLREFHSARSEAYKAFGSGEIFIEKYIENPRHIEVQILGDNYGDIVHLFERDCSIQRRHQKIIEFTPSQNITDEQRQKICEDAIKLAKSVNYRNAGTVEFLVDNSGEHYFIEMNPRIQVEHTVTELVTGIDIVQMQILIAQGHSLISEAVNIPDQNSITMRGSAIQCRITTEDPQNNFMPDTGKLEVYRTGSGNGVRLDAGNGFTGAIISPYYDSLLVKTTTYGRNFEDARRKAVRAVKEHEIEGVKTNMDFIINVLEHQDFIEGKCDTKFIDTHPELFKLENTSSHDEVRLLKFLGEKIVNETFGNKRDFDKPIIPSYDPSEKLYGTKQILDEKGPEGLVEWINKQEKLLITDTTMRDAHQSLLATRVRSRDMIKIAKATSHLAKDLFSLEMWGGATFDVSYRFLKESPWKRLTELRERIPNVLFQMLLRGSNAVGYKNYPDNLIREFVKEAAQSGIDVFRIFDSLNWLEAMEVSVDEVLKQGKVAEVSICYTGDILDKSRKKYDLEYYVRKAKEAEAMGAHILGIKDMAALLKPAAAYELVSTLKKEIKIPIHLHTHDTSGNGVATLLMASMAGVDIVDTAINGMSGLTSHPALNSIVAAVENTKRHTGMSLDDLQQISDYWTTVRDVYYEFESGLKSGTTEIYKYEIPGGQYSNIKAQVESFGLGHKFKEVKEKYIEANELFGDIVKVTPSSKVVGDMAIFMVQNELDKGNIYEKGKSMSYPDSVVDFFRGMIGQPEGGFNERLQKIVLKGETPIDVRPGTLLSDIDFEEIKKEYKESFNIEIDKKDQLAAALYPKVFREYVEYMCVNDEYMRMESDVFFHALKVGEVSQIEMASGKSFVVKLVELGKTDENGMRTVVFEVDGFRREIQIEDRKSFIAQTRDSHKQVDKNDPYQVGSSIPGTVVNVLVKEGDEVKENQPLLIIEAMKMETEIVSNTDGVVEKIYATKGQSVKSGELVIQLA